MYREALWRHLRFIQETRRQKDTRNENENTEDNTIRDAFADNETMNDDVFHDLTQTIIYHWHIPSGTPILLRKI